MFQFRLYYKVNLTGTWLPTTMTFIDKDACQRYIKLIKKGDTIYRTDLSYKAMKD